MMMCDFFALAHASVVTVKNILILASVMGQRSEASMIWLFGLVVVTMMEGSYLSIASKKECMLEMGLNLVLAWGGKEIGTNHEMIVPVYHFFCTGIASCHLDLLTCVTSLNGGQQPWRAPWCESLDQVIDLQAHA